MTDEQFESAKFHCFELGNCNECPLDNEDIGCRDCIELFEQLNTAKQLAETQLKELLSALYRQTDNKDNSFTIYRDDVFEIAKDYGIKEEELKWGKQLKL